MSGAGRFIRDGRRLYATELQYATRPYGVVTTATNPATDTITYTGPRAGRTVPITHPYLGPASWIRVMPERSTRMILDSRSDSGETFTSAYMAEDAAENFIRATYEDNRFYYRRLQESEIDITSRGLAAAHFGQDGTLSLRGGPILNTLDVPNLEANTKAPTIVHRTLDNNVSEISNEMRFGVVKRFTDTDQPQQLWIRVTPDGGDEVFAKEYLRHLSSKAPPYTLIDHREGHVVANDGTEPTSPITGKKLRSRTVYGTVRLEETITEVDVEGNVNWIIPDNASYGLNISVSRTDIKMAAGRDEIHNVDRNFLVDAEQTVELEAQRIKAGRNAEDPMMRGEDMRQWLRDAVVLTATGPAKFLTSDVEVRFTQVLSTKCFVE